jgi:hypothetical protein
VRERDERREKKSVRLPFISPAPLFIGYFTLLNSIGLNLNILFISPFYSFSSFYYILDIGLYRANILIQVTYVANPIELVAWRIPIPFICTSYIRTLGTAKIQGISLRYISIPLSTCRRDRTYATHYLTITIRHLWYIAIARGGRVYI